MQLENYFNNNNFNSHFNLNSTTTTSNNNNTNEEDFFSRYSEDTTLPTTKIKTNITFNDIEKNTVNFYPLLKLVRKAICCKN
jgi:hypothetical protein